MKLIKVDPRTSKSTRIDSAHTYSRRDNKVTKNQKIENRLFNNYINSTKSELPIVFHNVHSNKITEGIHLSEYRTLSDAFNDKFRKVVGDSLSVDDKLQPANSAQNMPLRIKIDPKYQTASSHMNKKFVRTADTRNRRITFIPSSPRDSSAPIFISDNLHSPSLLSSNRLNENCKLIRSLTNNLTTHLPSHSEDSIHSKLLRKSATSLNPSLPNSSINSKDVTNGVKREVKKQLVRIDELRYNDDTLSGMFVPSTTLATSTSLRKFSSDARVKLHKNKLQTSSDFSTGSFRVKIRGREKL